MGQKGARWRCGDCAQLSAWGLGLICFAIGAMITAHVWSDEIHADRLSRERDFRVGARGLVSRMDANVAATQAIGHALADTVSDERSLAGSARAFGRVGFGRLGLPLEGWALIRHGPDGKLLLDRWWPTSAYGIPLREDDAGLLRLLDHALVAIGLHDDALVMGYSPGASSTLGAIATPAGGNAVLVQVVNLDHWLNERVQMSSPAVAVRISDAADRSGTRGVRSSSYPLKPSMTETGSIAAGSGIWVIEIASLAARPSAMLQWKSLIPGGLASLALGLLVGFLASRRRSAELLVERRTRDLRLIHARLERALQATQDGIWEFSRTTHLVHLSASAQRLLGLPDDRDGIPARELLRRVIVADRHALLEGLRRMFRQHWLLDTECRVVDASGRLIWLRVRALPTSGEDVDLTGALSDVSIERRASEQVERQQDFVARVIDAIPSPIMVRNAHGGVLLANTAYLKGVGLSVDRLVGRNSPALIHDDEAQILEEADCRAFSENRWVDVQCWITSPGYGRRHYRVSKVPQKGPDGMPVLISCFLDTTRELAAVEQAARQHESLSRLVALMPVGVLVKDALRRVTMVNPAYCELLGLSAEELLGQKSSVLVAPELVSELEAEDARVEAGETVECLRQFLNRAGRQVAVRFRKSASVDADGAPVLVSIATDLTGLIEAQSAEREALARVDALYRNAPLGLVLMDMDGHFIQANQVVCRMLGYSEAQILLRDISQISPPRWQSQNAAMRACLRRDGVVSASERSFLKADGSEIPVRVSAALMAREQGEPLVWVVFEDISAELAAREALQVAERRWQFALVGAGDGVWDWDCQHGKVFYSPQWKAMLGYGEDEIGDTPDEWSGRLHPQDRERVMQTVERHMRGEGDNFEIEERLRCRDGHWLWILYRGKVIERASDGSPLRLVGTHTDISRQKAAQEDLKRARDMLEAISSMQEAFIQGEASPRSFDAVLSALLRLTDSRFGFVGEVCGEEDALFLKTFALRDVSWDESACDACARSLAEGMGQVRLDGVFGETILSGKLMIVDRPGGGSPLGGFLPGCPALENFLAIPVVHDGVVLGLLGVANTGGTYSQESADEIEALVRIFGEVINARRNRQARRAAERELKRHRDHLAELVAEQTSRLIVSRDAAEAANAAKTLFLANMSHELRTPLHAVLSFARLGHERMGKVPEARIGEFFARIQTSAERLLLLLNDLLDLSKLQAGRMPVVVGACSLAALVDDALAEFDAWLSARRIAVVREFEDPLPLIEADAARIGQVIRNLLSNAIKFSPEHSQLTLTLAHGRSEIGEVLELVVSDQGVGIPEDELESVFTPFVQSSATRTGAGGTGLGLAICREIVSAHSGSICARNNSAGGADFVLRLPLAGSVKKEQ